MTGIAALVDETVDQFEAGALAAPAGMELVRIAGERDRGQFIEGAARHYQRSAVAAQGTREALRSVPRAQAVWDRQSWSSHWFRKTSSMSPGLQGLLSCLDRYDSAVGKCPSRLLHPQNGLSDRSVAE